MLAFIDESGLPRTNDGRVIDVEARPVVVAACFQERDVRNISGRIHALKRDVLNLDSKELKGSGFLDRRTYRNKRAYRTFAAEFFSAVCNMPVTIFAVIMRGPFGLNAPDGNHLERRFQYLLERIDLLAEENGSMATVIFDGDHGSFKGLSDKFTRFLYRSDRGRTMANITDTPFFVDSANSIGIQIADMCAYVVREYHENRLNDAPPKLDDPDYYWLSAIRRWYPSIYGSSRNFDIGHDGTRYGFHFFTHGQHQ